MAAHLQDRQAQSIQNALRSLRVARDLAESQRDLSLYEDLFVLGLELERVYVSLTSTRRYRSTVPGQLSLCAYPSSTPGNVHQ